MALSDAAGGARPPAAQWRVHAVLPRSRANGPGVRFTVWVQGCSLGCAGCFNPRTHPAGQAPVPVGETVAAALAEWPAIEGVTLTGGEPLEQPAAVGAFCAGVKAGADLGVIVLTGFSPAEVRADPARRAAVAGADLVVAGRYNRRRHLGAGLRGSANKVYWPLTDRYRGADLAAVPETEILIGADGTVTVTGMSAAAGLLGGPAVSEHEHRGLFGPTQQGRAGGDARRERGATTAGAAALPGPRGDAELAERFRGVHAGGRTSREERA